jgi:ParB family transcriptional regulator, chromosome partitioning protein
MATSKPEHPTTAGQLQYVDPNILVIDENIRDNPDVSDILASIKQHGVLIPLTGVQSPEGHIFVREGQRRVIAAREAGLTTVPVYVTTDAAGSDTARTIERVTHQMVTNDHRQALTAAQRAKGIDQLILAGVSPTKVAKSLGMQKKTVDAAATAATSAKAMAALEGGQLSLEQAAVVAEFEADAEAVDYLVKAATDGDFKHRAQQLRQKAIARAAHTEAAKPYAEKGHTILDMDFRPWLREHPSMFELRTIDGGEVTEDQVAQHPECWAVHLREGSAYVDTRTNEIVDENSIDWDVEGDDATAAEDGFVHPKYIAEQDAYEAEYYCLNPEAAQVITAADPAQGARAGYGETEEQAQSRRDAERTEKRKVIALNRLGAAAQQVRQIWVCKLLERKTPPKGAGIFIARQLAQHPSLLTHNKAAETAGALLGHDSPDHHAIAKTVDELSPTGDARATVITLGLVLGAVESLTPKDSWRHTWGQYSKEYLGFLAANGYELAPVERVIAGHSTADELYAQVIAAKDTDSETDSGITQVA